MATLPGIPISENQCIGDSLGAINNAFISLSGSVESISSALPGYAIKNDPTITTSISSTVDRKFIPAPNTSTLQQNANLVWFYNQTTQSGSWGVQIQGDLGPTYVAPSQITTVGALRGQILTFDGTSCSFRDSLNVQSAERNVSFTLALTDTNSFIPINFTSSNQTLTIPSDSSVNFPIGTQIIIQQTGVSPNGVVSIRGATGVTVQSLNNQLSTSGQYATVTLLKRAANTWTLAGNTA